MSTTGDEPLAVLPVELAATRPAMIWLPWLGGIPVMAAALILAVFGELALAGKLWWMIFPALASWKVCAMLISRDYHALTLVQKYLATSAWTFDAGAQGGAGPTIVPHDNRARGM